MCETWNCSRYYCPFAHSMDELVSKPQPPFEIHGVDLAAEELRLRQLNQEDFWEDNDFEDVMLGGGGSPTTTCCAEFNDLVSLQMRRVVHSRTGTVPSSPLITATSLESSRVGASQLQAIAALMANNGASNPDPGWVTLTQGLRVELLVRGLSPLTGAELCLGTVRAPWETGAASAGGTQNRRGQQQASMVVKVIPVKNENDAEVVALMNQLQGIARSEHKNILSVKKIHLTRFPAGGASLVVAYERCSTSLYTTVAEGYRVRAGTSQPRGLAGRMHAGRLFSATSAAVGKIAELLSAMQRFHSLGTAHCRICPSNIFIDADANLKLGDFDSKLGLLEEGQNYASFLAEPVACWTAPEVIDAYRHKTESDTASAMSIDWKRADVFSAGLCVFLALTGQHPFGTFADEDRTAAAGAANVLSQSLFVEGKETVLENMRSLNMVNQHLLYGSPLLLDLVMRMLVARTEVGDLLTHPLFWDFYSIARFITRLDESSPHLKLLCETCPIPWTNCVAPEEWKTFLTSSTSPIDFKDTVMDLIHALRLALARHKASGCGLCSSCAEPDQSGAGNHHLVSAFVTRMVARFPALVIRAWDASKLCATPTPEVCEAFKRNHLSWMSSRPRLVPRPLPSHMFVREYYVLVTALSSAESGNSLVSKILGPDESSEILNAVIAMANRSPSVDPSVLSSMLHSFGSMMRSDMLPPNVPKSFVVSLIEAANASPCLTPSPHSSPPSTSGGVYYSTVVNSSTALPSGATTAASSPVFAPLVSSPKKGSPINSVRNRRMSSCDGWEYAVACPPTMMDLGPRNGPTSLSALEGDEDESPPPGFQTVWQSMAEDGL